MINAILGRVPLIRIERTRRRTGKGGLHMDLDANWRARLLGSTTLAASKALVVAIVPGPIGARRMASQGVPSGVCRKLPRAAACAACILFAVLASATPLADTFTDLFAFHANQGSFPEAALNRRRVCNCGIRSLGRTPQCRQPSVFVFLKRSTQRIRRILLKKIIARRIEPVVPAGVPLLRQPLSLVGLADGGPHHEVRRHIGS